jgi:hypothetical protein
MTIAFLVALVALVALVCVAGARAATPTHVSASGPHRVRAGQRVQLIFRGYARRGVPALWVLLDDRGCASRETDEATRSEVQHHARFHVHHAFKAELTIDRSVAGSHYACAYLVRRAGHASVARTSWHYVTRR